MNLNFGGNSHLSFNPYQDLFGFVKIQQLFSRFENGKMVEHLLYFFY